VQEGTSEPSRLSQIEASRSHQCLFRATNNSPSHTNGLHNLPACETEHEAINPESREGDDGPCKEPSRYLFSSHGASHAEPLAPVLTPPESMGAKGLRLGRLRSTGS
jgi:hypothetical protein